MFNFSRLIVLASLTFCLVTSTGHTYCARCVKIESERAQEQATHPHKAGYYEDEIGLNEEKEEKNDSSSKEDNKKEDKASSQPLLASRLADQNLMALEELIDYDHEEVLKGSSSTGSADGRSSNMPYNPASINPKAYSTIFTILHTKDFLNVLGDSFTLFIPSNSALRHLSPGMLQDLLRPENQEQLANLVSQHVLAKKLLKPDFNNTTVKTIGGRNLTLKTEGDTLMVNGAHVLRAEAAGDKGVIYIIDDVLIP